MEGYARCDVDALSKAKGLYGDVRDVTKTYAEALFFFFFFEQKTAYEILLSLVGSGMCIRDSAGAGTGPVGARRLVCCLLYTSDAADDPTRAEFGGRCRCSLQNPGLLLLFS